MATKAHLTTRSTTFIAISTTRPNCWNADKKLGWRTYWERFEVECC